MARGFNPLRAALGAVAGVTEGLQQRDVLAEEKRRQALLEARQKAQEEALLRQEQRELMREGFVPSERLAGMTMPGATPLASMQPTMRQKVGGQEYAYVPSIAQAEQHKADVMKRSLTRAEKGYEQQQEEKLLTRLIGEAKKGGRGSEAAARLFAANKAAGESLFPEPRGGGGELTALQRLGLNQEIAEAEAWFNTPEPDATKRRMVAATFNNMRKARPNADARELILATYQAIKARETSDYREAQTGAADRRGQKPAGRAPSSAPPGTAAPPTATRTPSAAPPRDELDAAYDSYNRR